MKRLPWHLLAAIVVWTESGAGAQGAMPAGVCARGAVQFTCPNGVVIDACDSCPAGGSNNTASAAAAEAAQQERTRLEIDADLRDAVADRARAIRDANSNGVAQFRAGHWDEAVRELARAHLLDPTDQRIESNLARAREAWARSRGPASAPVQPAVPPQLHHITDLQLPPPPPPAAPSVTISWLNLPGDWSHTVPMFDLSLNLEAMRRAFRDSAPLAGEFLRTTAIDGTAGAIGNGAPTMVRWHDRLERFRDLGHEYRQLVVGLVDRLRVAVFTGTDQTRGGGGDVNQFSTEQGRKELWGKAMEWGAHRVAPEPAAAP